ncbi:MAG: chromosome segregation protein SMC [Roseiflexaceae bacterium]
MYLKRLEIQGFKTFAAHTVLEFRPGITAVVGPNGSGKSNLNDAVRWVLGEQSYAALRSKRTEDIIFGGGTRRAPSGFAEVSLTIDNSDRLLPLPYNEVTITRRATRAGDNEYYINRSRVRLRDVQEAVAPLGGSYTIINQGLVDAALTLRPDERRRLFEDAAEISTFVARKSEAEGRLRETTTNVDRCADVLVELEPRLRSLKRQAALARSYRELSEELRALLLRHYGLVWRAARRALAQAEQAEQGLASELAARRAAHAASVDELRVARETLRDLRERLGALHNESSGLHQRAETLQRDLAVGAERLAALATREEEAERTRRDLALRREELERERAAIGGRIAAAEAALAQARAAADEQQRAIRAREDAYRAARQALDAAQREEAAAAAALAESRRRSEQLAARRARLLQEQSGHAEALARAQEALKTQQQALAVVDGRLNQAQQARQAAAQAEEQARADQEVLRGDRARADEALAAARRAQADLEARLETLNRLQRSYAGTFAGVKAAMQWAEGRGRAGFALVSSLVRTPAHLETAVEVALGARLQNIVVERWEDAEEAIEALKRNGAGRATFLPLDTIRRSGSDGRAPAGPGVLGVASELVDYDEHYRPVVQNLLGRTLVVEDLATARRELRAMGGGWTIVTLAGEQVSSGGAVTGGAQIKEAGVLRRERELRELPELVAQARAVVEVQATARTALEARQQAVERALREAEAVRRRAGQELETLREDERRARREVERGEGVLEGQRRRHDQTAADLAALDEQVSALTSEQSALAGRERAAQTQLAELRAAEQNRAEQDRAEQVRLAELRAAAATVEGELRAERALLQSQESQIARLEEQRAAGERRAADLVRERAATEERRRDQETAHAALLAQIDALRALIGPAEQELEALEQGRAERERREADLTATLLEAESAHGRALVEVQRARDRLDTIWERAAADDVDVEAIVAGEAPEALAEDAPPEDLQPAIQQLKQRIQRLGAVNPLALEEYEQEAKRYDFLTSQIDDLRRAAGSLRDLIGELDQAMRTRFETTFRAVAVEFEQCFTRLFGGGEARLTLTGLGNNAEGNGSANGNGAAHDFDDIGIDITVRPPGKRLQNISLLSGGERALTASALLFAILKVNPSPFCILDEVDAALDEANVGRFRALLTDLSAETQFMLVTHNRGTIEAADTIYGVSMGDDGASRVLSLRLEELVTEP